MKCRQGSIEHTFKISRLFGVEEKKKKTCQEIIHPINYKLLSICVFPHTNNIFCQIK